MSDPPPPRLSPDGKFYWDGARWAPMPSAGVQEVVVRGQMPTWVALIGLLLCAPFGLIMVAFTPWKLSSKVLIGLGGLLVWIFLVGTIGAHH